MKRQDRLAGGASEPHGTSLRHPRGATRAVDGEGHAVASREFAAQLHERPSTAT